jgi:hypothetical protein
LSELSELMREIEKLSPQSWVILAKYIQFLQWQEAQDQTSPGNDWSFSFVEGFKEAAVRASQDEAGMDVKMASAVVGGESRPAIWAHPPVVGRAVIEYYVPVPQQISDLYLRMAIGIRDGAEISEENLVAFGVRVNGLRVWGQQTNEQVWQSVNIPLNVMAGDMARIEFTTEALGSHEWTWAVWGGPELYGRLVNK